MNKTATERAVELWDALPEEAQLAIASMHKRLDGAYDYEAGVKIWMRDAELSFKEHARDQRHMCAESALNEGHVAHTLVMNTHAPGNDRPEQVKTKLNSGACGKQADQESCRCGWAIDNMVRCGVGDNWAMRFAALTTRRSRSGMIE